MSEHDSDNFLFDAGYLGIALTREDLERIEEAAPKGVASGERYEDMSVVDRRADRPH